MTLEEQAASFLTMKHIERVRNLINIIVVELLKRGENHDQSKLESPEIEAFTKHTPKLASLEFGSKEYEDCKKEMSVALDHHYANNRHHINHFKNGISDMNLVDIVEMFCDWKASSERQNNGNLRKSIDTNAKIFNIPRELLSIFENSINLFE